MWYLVVDTVISLNVWGLGGNTLSIVVVDTVSKCVGFERACFEHTLLTKSVNVWGLGGDTLSIVV